MREVTIVIQQHGTQLPDQTIERFPFEGLLRLAEVAQQALAGARSDVGTPNSAALDLADTLLEILNT